LIVIIWAAISYIVMLHVLHELICKATIVVVGDEIFGHNWSASVSACGSVIYSTLTRLGIMFGVATLLGSFAHRQ
jgi:hypothetical protein